MFNFNYYPSTGVFGLNADGGKVILERFFTEVVAYIDGNSKIYMPYSAFVGVEHDPEQIAPRFGFKVATVARLQNHIGEHVIYQISLV